MQIYSKSNIQFSGDDKKTNKQSPSFVDNRERTLLQRKLIEGKDRRINSFCIPSNTIQMFNPLKALPIVVDGEGRIISVHCPSEWRVKGNIKGYTNNHTVAFTLLCANIESLIKGHTIQEAIDILTPVLLDYCERILELEEGRGEIAKKEAQETLDACRTAFENVGDNAALACQYLEILMHGVLHLQQYFRYAFHQLEGGESTSNREQAAIAILQQALVKMREMGEDNNNPAFLSVQSEIIKSALQLLDLRGKVNEGNKVDYIYYLSEILDSMLYSQHESVSLEEEEKSESNKSGDISESATGGLDVFSLFNDKIDSILEKVVQTALKKERLLEDEHLSLDDSEIVLNAGFHAFDVSGENDRCFINALGFLINCYSIPLDIKEFETYLRTNGFSEGEMIDAKNGTDAFINFATEHQCPCSVVIHVIDPMNKELQNGESLGTGELKLNILFQKNAYFMPLVPLDNLMPS